MSSFTNTQYESLVTIKANINVIELKLERFMDLYISCKKIRNEMRTLLNEMNELENEKTNLLNEMK